jgi:peptide N-acetyl-beta-D-glucosaminyl asparaginase amidase A
VLLNVRHSRPIAVAALALLALSPRAYAQVGSANTNSADPPVARPKTTPCVVTLFDNVAFADYSPKNFSYAPPAACPGPWSKVVLTGDFNVTAGRQFDRTANVWIGGANVYFGTTAEPSRTVARSWHIERDLTDYSALLRSAQPGEADLGNTVDTTYTGILYGTVKLELYPVARHGLAPRTPDVVLPLSDRSTGGTVGLPTTTSTLARSFTLPTNIEGAFLDVIAQSQGGDEFWYTCAPDDVAATVQSCGATGFRETQVTIDGTAAGVAPVYPWIFTGGIDPYLWIPITGVQTLNFTPYRVDLTPFAGLLSDGRSHEVALSVLNANNYFSTTASLLLVLDHGRKQVTGAVTKNTLAAPAPVVTEALTTGDDGSVKGTVTVAAKRRFTIAGYVDTSHGRVRTELNQKITFSNAQTYDVGQTQYVQKIALKSHIDTETRTIGFLSLASVVRSYDWPLNLDYTYVVNADGTQAQTTTIAQHADTHELTTFDLLPVGFGVTTNAVTTSDTLNFNAAGALTSTSGRASSQSYFAVDPTGCYSRAIDSAAGIVTAIRDNSDCQ